MSWNDSERDEQINIGEEIGENLGVDYSGSGLFLELTDFDEVRKRTADGQGRINLGMDKAGEDVKVVILDE